MKINFFYFLLIIFYLFPKAVFAQESNSSQFVTIVNPVRISAYTKDPRMNFAAQYSEIQKRNLAATWLLTYDVISDPGVVDIAKTFDKFQELGLFFEVTPIFSSDAGVKYNKTDSWHRANSIFLSGYIQEDRIKLIDKAFEKFKQIFGSYPTSVGAWWIDSYALEYMKAKYNITANLTVSDQFSTDSYQVWGQYFSTPYYPSKYHAGMPAVTLANKLDIVTIQWAPRDPLNGYGKTRESLYSTQDYFTINLSDEYFEKLVDLYTKTHQNKFGHVTIGLEGDLSPEAYQTTFARQLDIIISRQKDRAIKAMTMKDFSNWYRNNFPTLSPTQIIQTDDLLGKRIKTIWYQSPHLRINILYDYDTKETKLRDFRTYHDNFQEPYYPSPNRDLNLSINLPSQIDSASNPDEQWQIFNEELENVSSSNEEFTLNYKNGNYIKLKEDKIEIFADLRNIPKVISFSSLLVFKKDGKRIDIEPNIHWNFSQDGLVFRAFTQEATYFLKQRKVVIFEILIVLSFFTIIFFIKRKRLDRLYKMAILGFLAVVVIGGAFKWYLSNSKMYFVNQGELDALNRLKLMPGNRIVIYDRVCLQCSWHTRYMPAIFANKRGYVGKVTGKKIIYNSSIFNAKTRLEARDELNKLNADYIYLVKFEDYVELAPFSPGDLNIEEIYSNANAQIWKIKRN